MVWLLLLVYQIKHFLADYPLQGKYMLGKFGPYPKYILPLLAHVGVHGVATFLIALCVKPESAFLLALFDMVVHFTMDRIKASPDLLGRFKALSKGEYIALMARTADEQKAALKSNTYFWWALGLDQMVHHLTHYVIIYLLLRS